MARDPARDEGDVADEPELTVFRTDRPGIRKVLGDLEAEIMELLWTRPADHGTTVREVFEVLYPRRRSAYTTLMSTMTRMARKRLLRVEKEQGAYLYYPTLDRDQFVSRFVGRVLEDLLVSFSGPTLGHLEALADPEAAASARALLQEIARRRASEEPEA